MTDRSSQTRVVLVVDDGSNPFELSVATEVFGLRRPELQRPWYDLVLCAPRPRVRMHAGFFTMTGVHGLDAVASAHTVIVPNRPHPEVRASPPVLDAVRAAAASGARLVSFCTGAFTLAEAGVLDDRPATTHWRWAALMAQRHPRVRLAPDVLFVDDGDVLTPAGSAAALDLALHLVRRDHGAEIAAAVSRRLVFAGHRDGGQRQFLEHPLPAVADASLAPLLGWARRHLDQPLTTSALARRAALSPATLHRRFRAELAPHRWPG